MSSEATVTALTTLLFNQFLEWHNRGYVAPSPVAVRHAVRARNGADQAIWLETACGCGDTTALLTTQGRMVIGIERERALFEQAQARFPDPEQVRLFHADTLQALPKLLPQLVGHVNFWLARPAAQEAASPSILLELAEIGAHLRQWSRVAVMVDGIRRFDPANPDYPEFPTLDLLVDWARANDLLWHIEHDIFIARNF